MSSVASQPGGRFFTEFLDDFFAECDEHLTVVRRGMLALEGFVQQPRVERALLDELFHSFHTLKGLAGMVGVPEVEQLAHEMEAYLRALRESQVILTAEALSALIAGTRTIEQVIGAYRAQRPAPDISSLLAQLRALSPGAPAAPAASPAPAPANGAPARFDEQERAQLEAARQRGTPLWHVEFTPSHALSARDVDVNAVRARLQSIGQLIHAAPRVLAQGGIAFDFLVASDADPAEFAAWQADGMIASRYAPDAPAPQPDAQAAENGAAPAQPGAPSNVVRVDLGRIDEVIRIVGELVIGRARLMDNLQRIESSVPVPEWRALQETTQILERQLRDLRQGVMQMRLVPIGEVFARMQFVARDLARESRKQVALEMSGQATEIDKFVVERMLDPLLHLVRNAVSHGLETAEERAALGKPPVGTIALRARAAGDVVIVEIEDDGRGVDPEQIAARARALGIIGAEEALDSSALLDVICSSGFSTREQADRVSGRGVGMAVVKQTVEALGGALALDTAPGRGTRFAMQLPLTLTIVDALIVAVGDQTFAVPLPAVREVIELQPDSVTALENNELLSYRGGVLPLVRLARRFGLAGPARPRQYVVVVGGGASAAGVVVDGLGRKREIVVRTMTDPLIQVAGLAGATELGDGRPVLILDANALIRPGRTAPHARGQAAAPPRSTSEPAMPDTLPMAEHFVLFELAGATYGLPSRLVRQIEMVEQVTPVPNAPPFVAGVVFARGQVIPALNMRARFGFETSPYTMRTRLIVVDAGERAVGLIVDTAREFVPIPPDAIRPPPESIGELSGAYLEAIATLGDRLILILDLDQVLLDTATSAPAPDAA